MDDMTQQPEVMPSDTQEASITSFNDAIEPHIRKEAGAKIEKNMDRLIDAGMKILFDKETHYKLFDSIRPEDEVPISSELGMSATNIMINIFNKLGGNPELAQALVPAGVILLARASDFINEQGLAQVTEQDFGEAAEMYQNMLRDKLDPEFSQKMRGGQQPEQMPQQTPQQNPNAQKGLLANNQSMA